MKDKKFLELLNLYLDSEIDPASAAELEQAILANPAQRRIYNDYCRIHRATQLVYEQFRTAGAAHEAPASRPGHSTDTATGTFALDGRSGGRAASRPFRTALFAGGLAAACAMGAFIGTQALAPRASAPENTAPAPAVAVAQPPPAPDSAHGPVVAASSVSAERTTFTAPFAPVFRVDPFVQTSASGMDPFALTTWRSNDLSQAMPAQFPKAPVLKIDPQFQPAADGFEVRTKRPAPLQRDKNPFRLRLDERSTTTPSYEFSTQP